MSFVIKWLYTTFQQFDAENLDTRMSNLFLTRSALPILSLSFFYLYFVLKLGPSLMKNRPAYELKYVMMIYNLFQVFANLYLLFVSSVYLIVHHKLSDLTCMPNDRSNTPYGLTLMRLSHLFYLLKVVDYMDTIFFVLRKRHKQISFLHVYHHFGMAVGGFVCIRYVSCGQVLILGYLNTYVHAVMYFYYFVSALRPAMKKSLWWKKYITQMQIVQFVLNIAHFSVALLRSDCKQSSIFLLICVAQNLFMAFMFIDFYIKAYLRKSSKTKNAL